MSKHSCAVVAVVSVSCAVTAPVMAGSHLWDIVEVFSSSDGSIQFIELEECCGAANETQLDDKTVTSTATGKVLTFTSNLPPNSTAHAHLLLATQAFADMPGAATPDYIIASNFLSVVAEPAPGIEYWNYDDFIFSAGMLPLNGKDSLHRTEFGYAAGPNSPTNFAEESGSVDACPRDLDGDGSVGINDFLGLLADWGNPYGINDFLALLAAWGPC